VIRYGAARTEALALSRVVEAVHERIVHDLGAAPPAPTRIHVTATREELAAALPQGARPPRWAAGLAFARENLIVLAPAAPGASGFERESLLAHELSHVALRHATRFRPLPIWFVEGFADLQAMAPRLGDWRSGPVHGGALPLRDLHRALGDDETRASRSYRQSYDLVAFLRTQGDPGAFRRLVERVARGEPFDAALRAEFHTSPKDLEARWRKQWNLQQVLLPLVTSGFLLWLVAAVLLFLAFLRKRRERIAALARMEAEESAWSEDADDDADEDPDADVDEDADEDPDADANAPSPAASPLSRLGPSHALMGLALALAAAALLSLLWPNTRGWILAGPAVAVALLALRWAVSGR
jgi:hypothetical protein